MPQTSVKEVLHNGNSHSNGTQELPNSNLNSKPPLKSSKDWKVDDSVRLYNVDNWGSGYFSVNESGEVICRPVQQEGASISLMSVIKVAKEAGLTFPLQIRFQDLLRHRVRSINIAFRNA